MHLVAQLSCPAVEALFLSHSLLFRVLGLGLLHRLDAVTHQVMIRPGALDPFSCRPQRKQGVSLSMFAVRNGVSCGFTAPNEPPGNLGGTLPPG